MSDPVCTERAECCGAFLVAETIHISRLYQN